MFVLQIDAKVEGNHLFTNFRGSTEYKVVEKQTRMYGHTFISAIARCNVYRADIRLESMNKLSEDFVRSVNDLPLDDYAPYLHLISIYGTHFLNSVVVGAKAIRRSMFTKQSWTFMKNRSINVGASAGVSFLGIGSSGSTQVSHHTSC